MKNLLISLLILIYSCKSSDCIEKTSIENQLKIKNINKTELVQTIIYKQQDNIVLKNKLKDKNTDKIIKQIEQNNIDINKGQSDLKVLETEIQELETRLLKINC